MFVLIETFHRAEWPRRLESTTGVPRVPLVAGLLIMSIVVLVRLLGGYAVATIVVSMPAAAMSFSLLERPDRPDATDQDKFIRRSECKSLLKFWTVFGALGALEGIMWPLFAWQPMLQAGKFALLAWCLLSISRGAHVYDYLPRLAQSCAFLCDRIPSHFETMLAATSVWEYAKLASSGRLLQELSSASLQHSGSSCPTLSNIGASTGISNVQAGVRATGASGTSVASASRDSCNAPPAVLPPLEQDLGANDDDDYELIEASSL